MVTDEIKMVMRVSRDGGDYCVKCPHCGSIVGIEGEDMSEIKGEQYKHRCGGWFEVSHDARYFKEI